MHNDFDLLHTCKQQTILQLQSLLKRSSNCEWIGRHVTHFSGSHTDILHDYLHDFYVRQMPILLTPAKVDRYLSDTSELNTKWST